MLKLNNIMKKPKQQKHRGSCLCGTVKFSFSEPLNNTFFCHCGNCRKSYGMYGAFAKIPKKSLVIQGEKNIKNYKSRSGSIRSFCKKCGSPIAWKYPGSENILVLLGVLDGQVKTYGGKHIWVSDKGGYYQLHDKLPKHKIY